MKTGVKTGVETGVKTGVGTGVKTGWFDIVSGARKGASARAAGVALRALSLPYAAGVRARKWLYARGILRTRRASVPVVSVGNLTLGGTGKTPLVEYLAKGLLARGRTPAVVMRGYGAPRGKTSGDVLSDEGSVLRKNLPGVPVIENPDRYEGVERAARELGVDVALLDDGFQHVKLARDLDVVAVDATSPFGFGRMFPAGCLREPPEALERANMIVVTRADLPPREDVAALRDRLREVAPMVFERGVVAYSAFRPTRLRTVDGVEGPPFERLTGHRIAAFCGIGNPYAFGMTVRQLLVPFGGEVVLARRFPDHHRFTKEELARLAAEAGRRKSRFVLTTQKDAARIDADEWPVQAPPLFALLGEVVVTRNEEALWRLVESVLR